MGYVSLTHPTKKVKAVVLKIKKNTVVQIHYDLYDADTDKHIETSKSGDPVAFLLGHRNVVIGLEEGLEGKEKGDVLSIDVPPFKGYGSRDENKQQRVPIKHLMVDKKAKLKPGMIVNIQTDQGRRQGTVVKAGKFNVDVDTNHPFAGKNLRFDVEVVDVRAATTEEIDHGHAHGVGGHHH